MTIMNSSSDESEKHDLLDNPDESAVKILAIFVSDKRIGVSSYDEVTNTIRSDSFSASKEELPSVLSSIKLLCQPSLILVQPHVVVNTSLLQVVICGWDGTPEYYAYQPLKNSCWNADNALEQMCTKLEIKDGRESNRNMNIQSMTYQENYLRLSSYFDMSSLPLVRSMGALLYYIRGHVFHLDTEVAVNSVQSFSLSNYMRMDQAAFQSLQVFSEDLHPNVLKGKGRSKEGFSVLGLLDRTMSLPGRRRLREWFTFPFCDRMRILERQDGVAMVHRKENTDLVIAVSKHLKHVHDLPQLVLRVKKVAAGHMDWQKIYSTLEAALPILDHCETFIRQPDRHEGDRNYLRSLLSLCNAQVIRNMHRQLAVALDFDASKVEGVLMLRSGYDQQLDALRHAYDTLDDVLTDTARRFLEASPLLRHVGIEYVPQIGYLVAVEAGDDPFLPNDIGAFQYVYSNENRSYYKHPYVLDLDDGLGDIRSNIMDRQKTLVLEIENDLLECEAHLIQLATFLESLDATISLGTIATEMRFSRPDIVEDPVIIIKGGRHPLQELTVDVFVPNDSFLSRDKHIALITGANGSGKSIYIKQVGLLVYLAHVGCWLPCERAIIGLTDQILTRVASVETVAAPLSAFALDLTQISRMVSLCTPRSLCLVDEFGKGTSPTDGMALMGALLKWFADHPSRLLAVLHFQEILHKDVVDLDRLSCVTTFKMEVHNDSEVEGDDIVKAIPLYKLRVGLATSSAGLTCAEQAGVPVAVTRRAKEIVDCVTNGTFVSPLRQKCRSSLEKTSKSILSHFLSVQNWEECSASQLSELKSLLQQYK